MCSLELVCTVQTRLPRQRFFFVPIQQCCGSETLWCVSGSGSLFSLCCGSGSRSDFFTLMRTRILLLIKMMQICYHWYADPPRLHFEPPSTAPEIRLWCGSEFGFGFWLKCGSCSQNYRNLGWSGSATLLYRILHILYLSLIYLRHFVLNGTHPMKTELYTGKNQAAYHNNVITISNLS